MREIIFRGKRIDNGELAYGSLVMANGQINNGKCYILNVVSDFSYGDNGRKIRIGPFVEVGPETVGQYTGLTDKNGNRIFDGDVVKVVDWLISDNEICRFSGYVDFSDGSFCIVDENEIKHFRWMDYKITVVGNIHDNPELLEATK